MQSDIDGARELLLNFIVLLVLSVDLHSIDVR